MKLRGKLVFFEFIEEGDTVYTIAQVSQIVGLNPALDEHPGGEGNYKKGE
jgi:hypothetical protein